MENEQANLTVDSVSPVTGDEKKIISRLILQRILMSETLRHVDKNAQELLSKQFLSDEPDKDVEIAYRDQTMRSQYYNTVANVKVKWEQGKDELQDLEGNVWSTYSLNISPSIGSSYSSALESFTLRSEILFSVSELFNEIQAMAPKPIRVMALDNAGRLAREDKRRYDAAVTQIRSLIRGDGKHLRSGLRKNGSARSIPRSLIPNITGGTYIVTVDDGSRYRKVLKNYEVRVPGTPTFDARIRRID